MGARKPRPGTRSLVMPPGRKIPRSPSPRPVRPDPPRDDIEPGPDVRKAAGDLVAVADEIRACQSCARRGTEFVFGTGYPRAPIMLVKERPSLEDIESGNAFSSEAEALAKAFDALGVPFSWLYGATAVRSGVTPATPDEISACAEHLLGEIESVAPRLLIAFGPRALDALRALDGRCGLRVPEEVARGEPVRVRSDLTLLVTEPLPDGVTQKDAKRRLWRDLQGITSVLGS